MNVLIVEDEKALADEIQTFLGREHFVCDVAITGNDASEKIAVNHYDFVLLDLGLPDYDGIDPLKEAKKANTDAAFIIITARSTVGDKIKGLDLGADDYVEKPFGIAELLARIRSALRRTAESEDRQEVYQVGGLSVDVQKRSVVRNGEAFHLTPKEYDLLLLLIRNHGRVMTHRQLLSAVWGPAHVGDVQYLRVAIGQLRAKIEHEPGSLRRILNEPAVG